MKNLIVNTGSASKKYAIYDGEIEKAFLHMETEEGKYICTVKIDGKSEIVKINPDDYEKSLDYLINTLIKKNVISKKEDINAIGIRVVAPGSYFQENRIIDSQYLKNLKVAQKKAPLHLEVTSKEIYKLIKYFGKKIKILGISDSEFHSTMPQKAKNYAICALDAKKHDIYRFGYHGISARSIVNKLKRRGTVPERMIICHIGGGVSIMAVKNGESIETSMGFTPLEGMVMANRVGDIDSGAVIYLSQVLKLNGLKLLQYLNKKCGLIGLSDGLSNDVRDLFKAEEENNDINATNALDTYVYKIQKQIGAYSVVLGGLDRIVFSGTVGERSYKMRKRICAGLESLSVYLDEKINGETDSVDRVLSTKESRIIVEVIKTDEMSQMAREVRG